MYIDQVKERWHKIGKDSLALAVHAHLYQWYRQLKSGIMFMGWVLLGLGLIALLVELLSRLPGWFGPIMFGPRQAVILMDKLSQVDQQLPPDVKLYFNTTSGANWLPLLIPVAGAILLYIVLAVLQPKLFPKPEQHIAYLVSLSAALALVTLFILPRFAPDLADQFQLCIVAYAIVAHARVTFNKKFAWLTEGLILLIVLLSIVFSGLQSYHAQIPLPTPSGDIVFKSLQLPIEKPDQWLLRIPMLGIQVGGTTQVFLLGIWLLGLLCLHIFTAIGLHERNARTRSDTLVKELTAAQEQLRAYALHAEDLATMRERSRVAREVHDTLAQGLAAIKMHLETGTQLFTASPQLASEHMELARELAGAYLKETRDSILDLRSDALDGRSLPSALAALVATWQDESGTHGPGGQVSFCVSRPPADAPLWQTLPPASTLACYRVAQEALSNASKHGKAQHIDVELSLERNELCLTITDDGQGFDPLALRSHKKGGGFGLIGMQERLKMLQGRLETISTPGVGTQIVAMIPLKDEVLSHKFAYNGGGTT